MSEGMKTTGQVIVIVIVFLSFIFMFLTAVTWYSIWNQDQWQQACAKRNMHVVYPEAGTIRCER